MQHTLKYALLSALCFTMLTLVGCAGSSDSSSPPATPVTKTGYIVSNSIEGMPYVCGSVNGKTQRLSQFTYQEGQPCTFSFGRMNFTVSADKVEKGYITAYDMTSSKTEAWTLMAIIDSISFKRTDNEWMHIVDSVLESRIPDVNLSLGDAAVTNALAPFNGTVTPVSVQVARERLAKYVNEDTNTLTMSHDKIVALAKEALDSEGLHEEIGKEWISTNVAVASGQAKKSMSYHDNKVNLVFYDHNWNPVKIDLINSKILNKAQWVTPGQNDANNVPEIVGPAIKGDNVISINYRVGRHQIEDIAASFQTELIDGSDANNNLEPMTLFADGAVEDQTNFANFPKKLNFAFASSLQLTDKNKNSFVCNGIVLGQGSKGGLLGKSLLLAGRVLALAGETTAVVETDANPIALALLMYSAYDFFEASAEWLTLFENWWVIGTQARTGGNRTYYTLPSSDKKPAIILNCNSTTRVVIHSTIDDHTFGITIGYPDQAIMYMSNKD